MNLICQNILKSLASDYVVVDLETTALNPKDGVIISMGFVPFTISLAKDGRPVLTSDWESVNEFWFQRVDEYSLRNLVFGNKETIEWHIENNEAFPFYYGLANEVSPAEEKTIAPFFKEYFGNKKYNFLSRHAFDAKWIAEEFPETYDHIHYRNFVDIANILKGTGIADKELYRTLEARAVERAKEYQTSLLPGYLIPKPEIFVKHRAISDCLIDMIFLHEVAMYIWRNAKTNVEI